LWRADARFEPRMASREADALYAGWCAAVARTRS
jgi:glycerol kinase